MGIGGRESQRLTKAEILCPTTLGAVMPTMLGNQTRTECRESYAWCKGGGCGGFGGGGFTAAAAATAFVVTVALTVRPSLVAVVVATMNSNSDSNSSCNGSCNNNKTATAAAAAATTTVTTTTTTTATSVGGGGGGGGILLLLVIFLLVAVVVVLLMLACAPLSAGLEVRLFLGPPTAPLQPQTVDVSQHMLVNFQKGGGGWNRFHCNLCPNYRSKLRAGGAGLVRARWVVHKRGLKPPCPHCPGH